MTTEMPETPIPSTPLSTGSLWRKMVRAAKLDINLYEEVEHDSSVTIQAFLVVVIVALAAGIGSAVNSVIVDEAEPLYFLWGLLWGLASAIFGWLMWSLFAYWLGTTIFRGPETEATYGQLLRTLGFANTPFLLGFFVFVPIIGGLFSLAGLIWALIAGVIAVRQALDFSTWRAIGTCIVGWLLYMLLVVVISLFIPGVGGLFG